MAALLSMYLLLAFLIGDLARALETRSQLESPFIPLSTVDRIRQGFLEKAGFGALFFLAAFAFFRHSKYITVLSICACCLIVEHYWYFVFS